MTCPTCAAPDAPAARFCERCGTPLHPDADRDQYYAAHPEEPVRALAVMSTLLPHLSGGRHHAYRTAVAVAVLASLVAAAFGVLSVALVCAAVALPALVLTYLHDHNAWHDEPLAAISAALVVALAAGIGAGFLHRQLVSSSLLITAVRQFPDTATILRLGVLIPVVAGVLLVVGPLLLTQRTSFRHPLDAVNAATIAGAAFSLGFSVVIQSGAFTHAIARDVDPARAAFIALTLGLLQPVLFAAAAALVVMRLRRRGGRPLVGVLQGLVLLVAYELCATMFAPYGARGIVLTALVAAVLAVAGLYAVRIELHRGLLAEAKAALAAGDTVHRPALSGQPCGHCGTTMSAGSAFCPTCGTATAALARPSTTPARHCAAVATA